ncbi:MAG TPA: nitrite/sulfite reductase [Thermoanaerobaculia bacterium]|nr:nitrite/sulfite reductase [Thermoanaerobaculia bacterium]
MSAVADSTLGRTRLSFANEAEIDEFAETLARFEAGEISADAWRAFRLVAGTYGQRQDGVQMLRVKVPQGVLSAEQLVALAGAAERFSRGFAHVTTRQNLQLHFVAPHDVEPAMRLLADAGLTTREACGNAVRNVTACAFAGVAKDEAFDVTPYAEATSRAFLRHPLSSSLPRKFKVAFEGCADDHAKTGINDLGFRAVVRGGARGFRVTAGGGTATLPTAGRLLEEFLPAREVLELVEAVLRFFHAKGDREHRNRNRMKFLIRELTWDGFVAAVEKEREAVRREGGVPLPFDAERPPEELAPEGPRPAPPFLSEISLHSSEAAASLPGFRPATSDAFSRWLETNVRPQRQDGFVVAIVTLPIGDVTGAQLRILADLALAYGDGTVRTTHAQDLLLRWIARRDLEALHARLAAAGLALAGADTIADVTSCPGAESCRLAVTQSRGLARLLTDHLRANPEIAAAAEDLAIKVSGCPNGCGQHHVADLGFQGSVRKVGGRAVPQYFLMAGGGVDANGTRFGRVAARIPAHRIPEALDRVLALYRKERGEGESAAAFLARVSADRLKEELRDLEPLTPETARPEDFVDLGESEAYRVETKEGECAT